MMLASSVFLALLAFAHATPVKRAMTVHENIASAPQGFTHMHGADPSTQLTLRVALTQTDTKGMEDALMAVSTPSSPQYGQFFTKKQVEEFARPPPETTAAVNTWLQENDITAKTISPAGDWLEFTVPVSKANSLLSTSFSVFEHAASGTQAVRTLSYSIPVDLVAHIQLVHPTVSFWNPDATPKFTAAEPPSKRPNLSRQSIPASCETTITPTCLQALYGIPSTPASQASNTLAVSGFIGQFANQADLSQFLSVQRPDEANATFNLQTLDGGTDSQVISQAGIEANLDTQYTVGVATGVPTFFVSVGNDFQDGLNGFLDIVNFFLNETTIPTVFTTSYGQNENTVSRALASSLCNAYVQLGMRGTSILFSSGDGGVAGSQTTRCSTSFLPTFPSGCPYMTSVGATNGIPEVAASFSSGGFSNFFAQPSYQAAAVSSYLSTIGSLNRGKFNVSGRAFPDVAAMGENVLITWQTEVGTVAGTSCSSPILASIIALLNDQLIAQGRSSLGFLNPFLYTNAAIFNDITSGNNPGCGTNGFPALAGWDPVTGVGTPNFPALVEQLGL